MEEFLGLSSTAWTALSAIGTLSAVLTAIGISIWSYRKDQRLHNTRLRVHVEYMVPPFDNPGTYSGDVVVTVSNLTTIGQHITWPLLATKKRPGFKTYLSSGHFGSETGEEYENTHPRAIPAGRNRLFSVPAEHIVKLSRRFDLNAPVKLRAEVTDSKGDVYFSNWITLYHLE